MSEKHEIFIGKKDFIFIQSRMLFSYKYYLVNFYYNSATQRTKFLVILNFPSSSYT